MKKNWFIIIGAMMSAFGPTLNNLSPDLNYLKIFYIIACSLTICYELLNLYFLHRFIKKNIKISEVLPDYIIFLLKELEEISSNIESIKFFKKSCYIHI